MKLVTEKDIKVGAQLVLRYNAGDTPIHGKVTKVYGGTVSLRFRWYRNGAECDAILEKGSRVWYIDDYEVECSICSRKNDNGVKKCWWCGECIE